MRSTLHTLRGLQRLIGVALSGLAFAAASAVVAPRPQIVIVIPEGVGFELMSATEMAGLTDPVPAWGKSLGWTRIALTSYPATRMDRPTGESQEPKLVYNPDNAWSGSPASHPVPVPSTPAFEGYQWLADTAPDGCAAATALNSGISTYLQSVNWNNSPRGSGRRAESGSTLVEWASISGLSVGFISDMPIGHPAGAALAGLHSSTGEDRSHLIDQYLNSPTLNVVATAGHPQYNALGQAIPAPNFRWITQQQWKDLRTKARSNGWQVIYGDQNLLGINATPSADNPRRFIILEYGDTTEIELSGANHQQLLENLSASLRFQTRMALDYLDRDPDGFMAVIHMGRIPHLLGKGEIEPALRETAAAHLLLTEIQSWMRDHSANTAQSLVVTPLYEYGLIWGSESARFPFAQAVNRGKGRQPGIRINHAGPTNTLVPVMLRGPVTQFVSPLITGEDPVYGPYLHTTGLHTAIQRLFVSTQVMLNTPDTPDTRDNPMP